MTKSEQIIARMNLFPRDKDAVLLMDFYLKDYAWTEQELSRNNREFQQQLLNLWVEWAKLQPPVKIYCVVENDMSVSVRTDMRLIYRGHETQAEIAYNALVAGLAIAGIRTENVNCFEFS